MARPDAAIAAVIGAGSQAATQVAAVAHVRRLSEIRVFSRSAERRAAFAAESSARSGVPTSAAASIEAAVRDADIVILATRSETPLIKAGWLKASAHVNTLGPRNKGASEIGPDVAERAGLIATDSPEQISAFGDRYFLAGTPELARMIDLADIVKGRATGRTEADSVSLFCSVGLAGTEVLLARALLAAAANQAVF
jgi:ornithine cyclodeaminase